MERRGWSNLLGLILVSKVEKEQNKSSDARKSASCWLFHETNIADEQPPHNISISLRTTKKLPFGLFLPR